MRKKLTITTIFLFFLSLYLLTMGGHPYSTDGMVIYKLTKSIIENQSISIDVAGSIIGENGRFYSKYGIGQSLLAMPLFILGKLVAGFFPPAFEFPITVCVMFSYNSVVSALLCVFIYLLCIKMGYSEKISTITTLLTGLTTMIFPYARYFYTHPSTTLCFILTIYFLYNYKISGNINNVLIAGIFQGLAVLIKPVSIIIIPAFIGYILAIKKNNREWIVFLSPVLLTICFVFCYNFFRFGNILEFGYGEHGFTFSNFLLKGLFGLTLSTGRGIFVYNPFLIMSVISFHWFIKRHEYEGYLFLSIILIYVLFYAKWIYWHGGESWGPRYLIPIIPLMSIPIAQGLKSVLSARNKKLVLIILAVFITLSFGVQIMRRLRNIGNTRGMIEDIQTLRASEQCLEQESIIFEELPDEEDS